MRYRERDRAGAVELALEMLATGRVRGVAPDHDPADLDAAIGPPASEWTLETGLTLVRDFGLLAVHCSRTSPRAPWRGELFVGRLRWMKKPLKWKVLAPELRRLGYDVTPYEVRESGATALIVDGHIYSVSSVAAPRMPADVKDFNRVHRTVYAATGRPRSTWSGWLAEHRDRLRTAELTVFEVLREHPSRAAEGVAFHAFLLDEAAGVWPADEWAFRFARFAVKHRDLPGVPTPDTVAARCLAALPMDRAAAARLPTDWRAWAPADVRASKMTRALLRYARDAAPQAPATLAELTRWNPFLTRLC
jgi:hypothetical protein